MQIIHTIYYVNLDFLVIYNIILQVFEFIYILDRYEANLIQIDFNKDIGNKQDDN